MNTRGFVRFLKSNVILQYYDEAYSHLHLTLKNRTIVSWKVVNELDGVLILWTQEVMRDFQSQM